MPADAEPPNGTEGAIRALAGLDLPIPLLLFDAGMVIRFISRAACEEYQVSEQLAVGRCWYDLVPQSRERRELHHALACGELDRIDLERIELRIGARPARHFSIRLRALRTADGRPGGILGLGEDVSAQVQAERALVESEERFRMISTHATDLVLIVARDGSMKFMNAAGVRMLGRENRAGGSVFQFLHPEDQQRVRELFQRLVVDPSIGVLENVEIRVQHADGLWRSLEMTGANLLENAAVQGIVLNGRDVTERKRMEQRLVEIVNREQDRIGQDLHDGLGQELTGIALMLRTIATSVQQRDPQSAGALAEVVGHVNHAIDSARSLAHGLAPVRRDRGGLVHALRRLARQVTTTSRLPVRFSCPPGVALTVSEPVANHLYRIAQEALHNAVRHARATRASLRLAVDGTSVELCVSDDGCGLPPQREDAAGMGLRIMAYRARTIGAELSFLRNPGGGTRVRVNCPQPAAQPGLAQDAG